MLNYKKDILTTILNNFDKFYIHIAPIDGVIIGERGLIDIEKEQGIVLVFGGESYKDLDWDEENIYVSMKFSGKWEYLTLPINSIQSIFDNPVNPNFIFNFKVLDKKDLIKNNKPKKETLLKKDNVISLDFSKKK